MLVNFEEKRRHHRIRSHLPLHYQIRGTKEFGNVISDDISLDGISFSNNRFIAPNTLLTLEINVLSRVLNPVGKIVRISSLPRFHRQQIGVEFLEFDSRQKSYLANYIEMKKV